LPFVTSMQISTQDLVGLISGLTVWVIAIIYFYTHPHANQSPTASIMGWSLTKISNEKAESATKVDNDDDKFKKTVHFPGDTEKFPEGTPDFSEPEISQSESVDANYCARASYPIDGLVV
jgi:hypothetical protein